MERVHHAGLTVDSLDRSIRFYAGTLGAKLLYRRRSETQGVPLTEFQSVVGVRRAKLEFAFLGFGETLIELICYESPRGVKLAPRHNDVGTPHIAFQVSDADGTYSKLSRKGVTFLHPPVTVSARPNTWKKGWKFTYSRGPDGELLEIFQELS